jgi:RNA polymerase sigma-70 factor, ECF subfamily
MAARLDSTALLKRVAQGDPQAAPALMPLVYAELRRLAGGYMRRERPDHTLQPTALVHEAYLKLIEQRQTDWQSRSHFFAIAAQVMRRILLDHARGHVRLKRGGPQGKLTLHEAIIGPEGQSAELLALDESLTELARLDPRQSRIVEMRFFGGLSVEETAEVLGISPKTVKRDWAVARAWLYGRLKESNRQ